MTLLLLQKPLWRYSKVVNEWIPYPRYIFRKEIALSLVEKYIPCMGTFLEIGCASGDFGIALSRMGYKGHLIDFSPQAINYLKNNCNDNLNNLTFEKANFLDFKNDNKFDLVILFEVLEHMKNDALALNTIGNLLNKNGFFICSVPAKKRLWSANDEFAGHLRRYEKKAFIDLLAKNDFTIVKLCSYGFPFLNILKLLRDAVAKKQMKKSSGKSQVELTMQSGMNSVNLKLPFLKLVMNKYFWYIFIKFSLLFNDFDLAEGYLVLAKRNEK